MTRDFRFWNADLGARIWKCVLLALCFQLFLFAASAQSFRKEFSLKTGGTAEIVNFYGKIRVETIEREENADETESANANENKVSLLAQSAKNLTAKDFEIKASDGKIKIQAKPENEKTRIDLIVRLPERTRVKIETEEGEISVEGDLESVEAASDTGTIAANVPLENLKYNFLWTQSRPRFLFDVKLEDEKEKSGGRFVIAGKYAEKSDGETGRRGDGATEEQEDESLIGTRNGGDSAQAKDQKPKTKNRKKKKNSNQIALDFSTARGVILLNVAPSEVASDLRERPLTKAAKAIVTSGDPILSDAIRRASPKHFGDFLKNLPPRETAPSLNFKTRNATFSNARVKQVVAKVMDVNNRAVGGLGKADFVVTERGIEREVLAVEPVTAPFNLVLLLDVSGSVDNYVNFIRKAARSFLAAMNPQDKITIIVFNEDVNQLTAFTEDRAKLSESLDSFDAGGATAYYDALGYSLVETLKPFKGERTAIVVLSDGDDNRSFLPFEALLGTIQESGALIYPLYVPTSLAAASATNSSDDALDPLRTRYMGLTSKAEAEGARLAQVSGGVYYPIRRIGELQKAYEDIVVQLRTSYAITFASGDTETGDSASPKLRVRAKKEGTFVNLGAVKAIQ